MLTKSLILLLVIAVCHGGEKFSPVHKDAVVEGAGKFVEEKIAKKYGAKTGSAAAIAVKGFLKGEVGVEMIEELAIDNIAARVMAMIKEKLIRSLKELEKTFSALKAALAKILTDLCDGKPQEAIRDAIIAAIGDIAGSVLGELVAEVIAGPIGAALAAFSFELMKPELEKAVNLIIDAFEKIFPDIPDLLADLAGLGLFEPAKVFIVKTEKEILSTVTDAFAHVCTGIKSKLKEYYHDCIKSNLPAAVTN